VSGSEAGGGAVRGAARPDSPIWVAEEVAVAVGSGGAVVALESTIISHGMPYPANVETARAVEAVVRAHGAVPATVAVVDGQLRVGLDGAALDRLADGRSVLKASRRDLAVVLSGGETAGTTVAATMYAAHRAGIPVFATGGIGGVHRGAERSFDVSADLAELGRTPVAVVCAGAKSILDIPKTLEVLETYGVPVLGYRTADFPAFFSRTSGCPVDCRVDTIERLAAVVAAHRRLGQPGGILIGNPVPEDAAIPAAEIDGCLSQALAEAGSAGIRGKDVTPFLLRRITELTGGRSLTANVALIRSNAALAADLALALAAGDPSARKAGG
jgi:pseudouridine-5'-phosphate glycosidase